MNKESFSFPSQFIMTGHVLSDFITTFPYPANVKDLLTGKYLLVNQATVELCGLKTTEQFIGLTVNELENLSASHATKSNAHSIESLDTEVRLTQKLVEAKNQIHLNDNGFVKIYNIVKIPVFNQHNLATAIFTYSHETTKTLDLLSLFAIYKQFYTDSRAAIQHFLRYLKIEPYFSESLTETELLVLIAMKYNSAHKSVARKLGVQPKTVEIHAGNLRNKLKDGCLYKLLALLRHEPPSPTE